MNADSPNPSAVAPAGVAAIAPVCFSDRQQQRKLRDELRAEEWALHKELVVAARAALKSFYENPHKITVADLARLTELASRLGRLATELGAEAEFGSDGGGAVMFEFHAALRKVYARHQSEGRPVPPGVVIDVTPASEPPAPPPAGGAA